MATVITGNTAETVWTAPMELDASTDYELGGDIYAEGTAFWIAGDGTTLDLKGYTIYYDYLTIPAISNGTFESDDLTGWNFYDASTGEATEAYEIVAEEKSIGTRTLHLTGANGAVVYSPSFQIPRAD